MLYMAQALAKLFYKLNIVKNLTASQFSMMVSQRAAPAGFGMNARDALSSS